MLNQKLGGRYRVISPIGGGGFGQTYLAEDWHLPGHPQCVVKQLKPRCTDGISLESARRLFDAEAQALYQLGAHDRIPRLLAHFEENQQFYLAQEYIEGTLLSDELQAHAPLPEAAVIDLLFDVLETLCFVHNQQVIHRDIKPSNLIRRHRDQKIVIIDFGSVKQVSGQPVTVNGQVSITIAVGSMGYMPNEQLAGQPCLSSDVYAVGMLALQALTGMDPRRYRKDPRTSEILWHDLVSVSPEFRSIVDTMIRYDHRQRYPSAQAALSALKPLCSPATLAANLSPGPAHSDGSAGHHAWRERGDDLFQLNRYQDAITAYEKFLKVAPEDEQVWFKQGLAFEHLAQYEAAVTAYDRVLQLCPDDYLAWLKRAKALECLHQFEGALAAYEEVLRLQPDNYWTWCDQGQVLEQLSRIDEAIAAYDRAIQLKPDFQLALDRRCQLLQGLQQVEQLYQLQHYEEAITACDQRLAENQSDSNAWLMRGMAAEKLNRLPAAAVAYDRVVRLQPDDPIAWFKLGSVLEKLERYRPAALAYSHVIRIQPSNCWAWYQRGQMLENLNQIQKALAAYNEAIQIKPDFESALTARQRLLEQLWGQTPAVIHSAPVVRSC